MPDPVPKAQKNVGNALELAWNQLTIREANLVLEQARRAGDGETICAALIQLAHLHFRQGRYHHTRLMAAEVLRDAAPDSLWRCDALRMLGNCAAETGQPDPAEAYYHQAIDLARQLEYRYGLYKCLHSLATNVYWPRGQFALCLSAGKEALAQAQSLDLGEELWFPLSDIGWVYWVTGQRELANQVVDQMQAVVCPGSLGAGFTDCIRAGQIEPGEGYLERVLPLYDRARSIAEATGDPGLNVEVRLGLCRAYRAVKDLPAAITWADDTVATSERMHYRQLQGVALIERGRTRLDLGDLDGAQADLFAACEISTELHSNFDLSRARLYLAAVLSARARPEADDAWQQTIRFLVAHGYDFLFEQERSLLLPWIAQQWNADAPNAARTNGLPLERLLRCPPAPLQVKTLGQFGVWIGANRASKDSLRQRRAGELLALLLSSPGHTLSAAQVTEAMCPEKEIDAAVDFYHHAISALRRLLEPDLPDRRFPCRYLEVSEERVTLILPPYSKIDFVEFDAWVRQKSWEKAIALYQGEYLPLYRYADWAIGLRQHFADQFELALLALAAEKLNDGSPAACLELARRVLLQNAWQEQAVALGMRAALELDDRATALTLYQRLEKKLGQELGIAPQKQLQQLFAEIRKRPKKA
jgi:DNA-binding SARP family transcriptional activator